MKVTIDDTTKTIEIEEDVNIDELFTFLAKRNINFEEYSILSTKIEYQTVYPYPTFPLPSWEGLTYEISIT